jgi:hypothetical protein
MNPCVALKFQLFLGIDGIMLCVIRRIAALIARLLIDFFSSLPLMESMAIRTPKLATSKTSSKISERILTHKPCENGNCRNDLQEMDESQNDTSMGIEQDEEDSAPPSSIDLGDWDFGAQDAESEERDFMKLFIIDDWN